MVLITAVLRHDPMVAFRQTRDCERCPAVENKLRIQHPFRREGDVPTGPPTALATALDGGGQGDRLTQVRGAGLRAKMVSVW